MTASTEQLGTRTAFDCLAGGGETGALMRSIDWAKTPLGPVESWPQSLRTSISICLNSRFPMSVWWGPELVMLYNDAYRPMLGASKHPQAMGRPGREVWPEIWPILGPMLEGVLARGEATWSDDQRLTLDRDGFLEECYFTFSYSPIRDESGSVGGVFCAVTETTWRVLGERRLQTLRALGEQAAQAQTVQDAGALATRAPASGPLGEAQAGPAAPGAAPDILVADDDADLRDYVRRLLGRSYEVRAVANGWAALEAARERVPDLVLADVMMPELDGFELLRELRADGRTREVPVILISARAGEESRIEGIEAGADDYLVKPFSARELLVRVESHLRFQRVRRESQQALRESEAKFSTAFGRSPLALTITSLDDGRLVEVNEGFVQLSGYSREEAIGRSPEELGLWVKPEVRAERFARLRAGEPVPNVEARFRIKSGRELIGVVGSAVVEINGRQCVLSSVTDITAQKQMEEALKEASRRKDEFLAMLAHELRNPLAPIRNAAQVLKLVGPADAHQQWAREVIERQTQHLTRLVDDLLDVSRLTLGKVALAREPLDLASIVHRAVETSRPRIDARRHRLTVALPPEPVPLEGDLTRLVQVVGNLLNNAAKYTDEGGHIHIEAAREGGEAVIRVRDDGMGLPADLLPDVFDLFTQADRSLDRSQGGLGIGLTLVRQLVEMHGGRVEAKSDGPGKGSELIVRLPAAAAAAAAEADEAAGERTQPAANALRILVVEDNVDSAEMLGFMLKLGGHEVRTAHDGPAALEAVCAFTPQVVLCDIGLPGMNGYEVAARLREHPACDQALLVALTGYGQEEARRRAQAAGFHYHLVKPVEPDALTALLDSLRPEGRAG